MKKKIWIGLLSFLFLLNIMEIQAEQPSDYPDVKSDYLYLVDLDNNQVMLDEGSSEEIFPASMTKIMTLIVAIENAPAFDEEVTLGPEVFLGLAQAHASVAGFKVGERVSVLDLLYGLFVPSGADAAQGLALLEAQGEEGFVELMNQKARELNMNSTHFVNTSGLHDPQHVTTLQDLAILLRYCLKNETFKEIFETKKYTAKSASLHPEGLVWESTLFSKLSSIDPTKLKNDTILGGKTGYTNPAGLCLASVASQESTKYMLISAHAPVSTTPYHIQDAVTLYDYYFSHYQKKVVLVQDQVVGQVAVDYVLLNNKLSLTPQHDVTLNLLNEVDPASLIVEVKLDEKVQAPIEKGQVMATLLIKQIVENQEQILYQQELVSNRQMDRNFILYGLACLFQWIREHGVLTFLTLLGFVLICICIYDYRKEQNRYRKTKKRKFRKWLSSKRKKPANLR